MSDQQTQLTGPDLSKVFRPILSPTEQRSLATLFALRPRGVGVVIEAVHLCMMMRGVEKQNSKTITSAVRGQFRECPMTRDEFLRLAHQHE